MIIGAIFPANGDLQPAGSKLAQDWRVLSDPFS